jgi:hypothetical protein
LGMVSTAEDTGAGVTRPMGVSGPAGGLGFVSTVLRGVGASPPGSVHFTTSVGTVGFEPTSLQSPRLAR